MAGKGVWKMRRETPRVLLQRKQNRGNHFVVWLGVDFVCRDNDP